MQSTSFRNPLVSYRVDSRGRIVFLDPGWSEFALRNAAPDLIAETVLHRPLLGYISGRETRHIYELMLESVRSKQRDISFPFRCDSPSVRRFMKLAISALPENHIMFQAWTLREERRTPRALLDPSAARSESALLICSWCKRVELSGEWLEIDEVVDRRQLFCAGSMPQLTHGICAVCNDRVLSEIETTSA